MTAIVRQPKSADCAWSRHIKCLSPSTCGCTCHTPEAHETRRAVTQITSGIFVDYDQRTGQITKQYGTDWDAEDLACVDAEGYAIVTSVTGWSGYTHLIAWTERDQEFPRYALANLDD